MGNEIIINTTGRETRVAVMERGQLAELHIDRGDHQSYIGNVYLGKVVRVLPGMQAAFVEIGLDRAAFLYAGDIYTEFIERTMDTEPTDDGEDHTVIETTSSIQRPHQYKRCSCQNAHHTARKVHCMYANGRQHRNLKENRQRQRTS